MPPELPSRPDGYALLEVEDTGVGMDENTAARVFEPSFSTKSEAGHGLGMAIVYGIVREHEGAISLTTARNQGTTVQVYFPATPVPAEEDGQAAFDASPAAIPEALRREPSTQATVLVVDDRDALRAACAGILARAGYQVLQAESGEEALRVHLSAQAPLDLALIDSSMPGLSERATFEALRQRAPDLKVIFMSGYASDQFSDLEPGSDWSFLQKPFDSATLLAAIETILQGAQADRVEAGVLT